MIREKTRAIYIETKEFFIKGDGAENVLAIFLCGSNQSNQRSFRDEIQQAVQGIKSKFAYRVYYPEKIFMELIYGHQKRDLLSLENVLAESVHSVAILLESVGTIAELGAFANHAQLSNKMVVFIKSQHKNDKSFINLGPIRHLREKTSSEVVYIDFKSENINIIAEKIRDHARKSSAEFPISYSVFNPIILDRLLLGLIYIFDPIPKNFIIKLIADNETNNYGLIDLAEAILHLQHSEGKIFTSPNGISTTEKGSNILLDLDATKAASHKKAKFLHAKRLQSLNLMLRNPECFQSILSLARKSS